MMKRTANNAVVCYNYLTLINYLISQFLSFSLTFFPYPFLHNVILQQFKVHENDLMHNEYQEPNLSFEIDSSPPILFSFHLSMVTT